MMRRKLQIVLVGALVSLYIGTYVVLSARGEYVTYRGGGADGSASWFPFGTQNTGPSPTTGRFDTEYPNLLGCFYGPLLLVDRWLFHPDTPGMWDQTTADQWSQLTGRGS